MLSVFLEILSSMPAAAINIMSDVPPALIKGSVWPVGGTELVATPMFTATCMAITLVIPAASRLPNLSLQRAAMRIPRQTRKKYAAITSTQPMKPSSSPIMANIKSLSPYVRNSSF